ncbi:DNA-binding response regulator [Actinomadura sp. NBRC 104412]|uniref:response regulator transcription factor n=1 Tax=Actinomadura sp. NBRC 104412 TaxID=3032203 RepID=UPI0024A57E8F|nr:response regulator transcription factor [Actinomadura sp. NBRC 104412]GLZ07524.1 DNA-binding response regulator [Actinomadura sp. NBRC 104412]
MIRILLVDDQQLVRMGLTMLCESAPDMEIVGEAANGLEAVRLVERLPVDVVLMDLHMPGMNGATATQRIMTSRPSTRVLALTTFDDDDHLYPALAAGACGFVVKDTPPGELLDAIRRAADGGSPFSQSVLSRLVDQAVRARGTGHAPSAAPLPELSPREREVLTLVAAGHSNQEIAQRLHLGVTTVKTHVGNLMNKTGTHNRIRLAVLAVRAGISEE